MLLFFLTKADSGPLRFGPPSKTVGLEREIAGSSVHHGYEHCLAKTLEFLFIYFFALMVY